MYPVVDYIKLLLHDSDCGITLTSKVIFQTQGIAAGVIVLFLAVLEWYVP